MLPKISEAFDDEAASENGRGKKSKRNTTGSTKSATVPLTWEQLQKLWSIVMGGQLISEENEDSGEISYHVSIEAISKAVPVLLEKL